MDRDEFVRTVGHLFEGSPWIARAAWDASPFASVDDLHGALCSIMYSAPEEQQLALIRAHPDLAGKAALAGTLSSESAGEQAAAGLGSLTPEELARFTELNEHYRDRFGFPFVICARENQKESILRGFEARLPHSRKEEMATALAEIAKIARLRLLDAVTD